MSATFSERADVRYVEVYRPRGTRPNRTSIAYRVHRTLDRDALAPTMTAVFEVQAVITNAEAIGCVLEHAAGFGTLVRVVLGGRS